MNNKNTKPRKFTEEEAQEELLNRIVSIVKFNAAHDPEKLDLLSLTVHQILGLFDGADLDLPGYEVCPLYRAEDKRYHKERGENYYPRKRMDVCKGILAGRFAMKLGEKKNKVEVV